MFRRRLLAVSHRACVTPSVQAPSAPSNVSATIHSMCCSAVCSTPTAVVSWTPATAPGGADISVSDYYVWNGSHALAAFPVAAESSVLQTLVPLQCDTPTQLYVAAYSTANLVSVAVATNTLVATPATPAAPVVVAFTASQWLPGVFDVQWAAADGDPVAVGAWRVVVYACGALDVPLVNVTVSSPAARSVVIGGSGASASDCVPPLLPTDTCFAAVVSAVSSDGVVGAVSAPAYARQPSGSVLPGSVVAMTAAPANASLNVSLTVACSVVTPLSLSTDVTYAVVLTAAPLPASTAVLQVDDTAGVVSAVLSLTSYRTGYSSVLPGLVNGVPYTLTAAVVSTTTGRSNVSLPVYATPCSVSASPSQVSLTLQGRRTVRIQSVCQASRTNTADARECCCGCDRIVPGVDP